MCDDTNSHQINRVDFWVKNNNIIKYDDICKFKEFIDKGYHISNNDLFDTDILSHHELLKYAVENEAVDVDFLMSQFPFLLGEDVTKLIKINKL